MNKMGKKELNSVPCPVCKSPVTGVMVDEESITEASRVPVLVAARCSGGEHAVILFVDKQLTIRDVEAAGDAAQQNGDDDSVDKAQEWLDSL
jgi:hypothetical protein